MSEPTAAPTAPATPAKPKPPSDFKRRRILGVVLAQPVSFAAKTASRFYVTGSAEAIKAAGGLQSANSDAVIDEIAWAAYGLSVVVAGKLRGGGVICEVIALGAGDRVTLDPTPPVSE